MRVYNSLLNCLNTKSDEIREIVISKDIMFDIVTWADKYKIDDSIIIRKEFRECYFVNHIGVYETDVAYYMNDIPLSISDKTSTFFISFSDGNVVDVLNSCPVETEQHLSEILKITVEDLERIWYGGF